LTLSAESSTFEYRTDRLSRNVSNNQQTLHNIPEEQRLHSHCGGDIKLRNINKNALKWNFRLATYVCFIAYSALTENKKDVSSRTFYFCLQKATKVIQSNQKIQWLNGAYAMFATYSAKYKWEYNNVTIIVSCN
jgi:hypothetical protein